jgi:hypothetical protein
VTAAVSLHIQRMSNIQLLVLDVSILSVNFVRRLIGIFDAPARSDNMTFDVGGVKKIDWTRLFFDRFTKGFGNSGHRITGICETGIARR